MIKYIYCALSTYLHFHKANIASQNTIEINVCIFLTILPGLGYVLFMLIMLHRPCFMH